ncbi:hypothetical protein RchiOBHm_Chr3g0472241 [Rosa chinensis]|uniref:Uncharacterized protein n=1 Tax=Rosa chinensis TaxID=74649 RepID=A0A2P6RBI6_ROSCH|nr:hypothetical protein RchiOBHm_Chr3g0472241 [Rosa chinensis]
MNYGFISFGLLVDDSLIKRQSEWAKPCCTFLRREENTIYSFHGNGFIMVCSFNHS